VCLSHIKSVILPPFFAQSFLIGVLYAVLYVRTTANGSSRKQNSAMSAENCCDAAKLVMKNFWKFSQMETLLKVSLRCSRIVFYLLTFYCNIYVSGNFLETFRKFSSLREIDDGQTNSSELCAETAASAYSCNFWPTNTHHLSRASRSSPITGSSRTLAKISDYAVLKLEILTIFTRTKNSAALKSVIL
jgi:hypothetical protein